MKKLIKPIFYTVIFFGIGVTISGCSCGTETQRNAVEPDSTPSVSVTYNPRVHLEPLGHERFEHDENMPSMDFYRATIDDSLKFMIFHNNSGGFIIIKL